MIWPLKQGINLSTLAHRARRLVADKERRVGEKSEIKRRDGEIKGITKVIIIADCFL